jgi:tape measure domain-containing protein
MASKRFSVDAVFRGINKISKPVRSMSRSISRFVTKSNRQIGKLGAKFKKLGSLMASSVSVGVKTAGAAMAGLAAATGLFTKEFSKLEDAEAAFTPLLGGAEKAKKLVDELNKTAASTPFQFENLAGVANQLLPVMDGDIQNTIKTLRMMGDTAGGNAQKLETITRGFTKAMLKGKVDLESLNMIAEAGVPIFGELAKTMDTEVGEDFFKGISAGEIKTDDLIKTFERMTKKGGLFFKGMEIASKTTTGVISTMKDNISLAAASVGKILAPTVKKYASKTTEAAKSIKKWVSANEELISSKINLFLNFMISTFKTLISIGKKVFSILSNIAKKLFPPFKKLFEAFMGAARAILPEFSKSTLKTQDVIDSLVNTLIILAKIGTKAFEFIKFAAPFLKPFIASLLIFKGVLMAIAVATKIWIAVQTILNVVLTANPIGLIIIAIAALIAGIILLVQNWDTVVAAIKTGSQFIWKWFSDLLDNPFFKAIAIIFLPFITIPALIVKHWEPIKGFFTGIWNGLTAGFNNSVSTVKDLAETVPKFVKEQWEPIEIFFKNLWSGMVEGFQNAMKTVTGILDNIQNLPGVKSIFEFLGVGDDNKTEAKTPQERLSRTIEERTSENNSTLTINDNTGRAELSKQKPGGVKIALESSGGF